MAMLTIRSLEEDLKCRLQLRAARADISSIIDTSIALLPEGC